MLMVAINWDWGDTVIYVFGGLIDYNRGLCVAGRAARSTVSYGSLYLQLP